MIMWAVWDILTHRTYRVKIIKYKVGRDRHIPQVRYSLMPVMWWPIITDHYYGTTAVFLQEHEAWNFICEMKDKRDEGKPVEVKFKYEE